MRTNVRSLLSAVAVIFLFSVVASKCHAAEREYKGQYAAPAERVYEAALQVAREHYKLDENSLDAKKHTFAFTTGAGLRSWGLRGNGIVVNSGAAGYSILILNVGTKMKAADTSWGAIGELGEKFIKAVGAETGGLEQPIGDADAGVEQSSAQTEDSSGSGFPLTIHITAIDMQQQDSSGQAGGGSSDSSADKPTPDSAGKAYEWHLYSARIDGDKKTYGLTTRAVHYSGGEGLAVATLGWSAFTTSHDNLRLHIGEYHGRWNEDGTLEIQFADKKGKLKHQTFHVALKNIG
jgi:hypothetical protein